MARESAYQRNLIRTLETMFPDCFVLKNDPTRTQGIPDLLILWTGRWAMLEVKRSASEPIQPNQAYYVGLFDSMSFASFIYPENEEEVLEHLYAYMTS